MTHIITNHSPADDYRRIQSQIKYTVRFAPYTVTDKPDREEKLKGSRTYGLAYKWCIRLLILTGIGVIVCVASGFIFAADSFSDTERKLFAAMVFATAGALLASLLICFIFGPMELLAEKKDREIAISLDNITWILNNGQVVVSDEQRYRCVQRYNSATRLPIAEAPFKVMKIVYKVYDIAHIDGKIRVDADVRELYRKHPYVNEGPTVREEDNVDRHYYYCQRDRRQKVYWYENMYGRERLLEALEVLKKKTD